MTSVSSIMVLQTFVIHGIMCQLHSTYDSQNQNDAPENSIGLEGYDGGDYGGYGYGEYGINPYEYTLDKIEPAPIILKCYTCHYTKMKYHEHGMPNCDEPFKENGIPVVTCNGLCAKTKSVIGPKEYIINRSCMPNCQTIYDEASTVECCYGNKCNGAKSGGSVHMPNILLVSLTVLLEIYSNCFNSLLTKHWFSEYCSLGSYLLTQ